MSDAPSADAQSATQSTSTERPIPEERAETTVHSTTLGGVKLAYTATAGTLLLKDDRGAAQASVFYVAYCADTDEPERPITFCFNGGPGSSAVWLHLGTLGPRRVEMVDARVPAPPPYRLVDNADGILDATDLVFIDPVGTGFSTVVGKGEAKQYQSVAGDAEALAAFIWRYIQQTGRWNAPRYIAGESYGTTRAAAMAGALQKHGLTLNGLVLISAALDFSTFIFKRGHDLPYQLFLPTYAATAWYHDLLPERPADLAAFVDEVRVWSITQYGPALMMGAQLNLNRRAALAEQLYAYTGVPAEDWLAADLRIADMHFAKRLLGAPGQTVGRLDSRYVGPDTDPLHHAAQNDPSFDAPHGPYTSLINGYLRRTLGFDPPERYVVFSFGVNEGWSWASKTLAGFPSTADDLRQTLIHNPHLKVLVANGYYDLATPFFAAEHSVDHLGVSDDLRENISLTYYEAGHMMYLHPPSRAKLRADLLAFYAGAAAHDDTMTNG